MRSYNQRVPEEKKVRFYGLDVAYNEIARKKVLAYLQKYAPGKVEMADSIFGKLAIADEKWPMRMGECKEDAAVVLPQLQKLIQHFIDNKTTLIQASSPKAYEEVLKYTKVMEQHLLVILTYPLRTRFMAENALYILEKTPGAKLIVSAHNRHINVIDHIGDTNMGHDLRDKLKEAYYAIGFETSQGSYQARAHVPDKPLLSDFKEVSWQQRLNNR